MVANKKGPGMGTQSPNALEDMLNELASGNAFSKRKYMAVALYKLCGDNIAHLKIESASARRQSIMVGKAPQPAMQPEFLLKKLKPTGGDNQPPKETNTTNPSTLNLPKLNPVGAKTGSGPGGDANGKISPRDSTAQPGLSAVKPSTPKQAATPTPAPVKQVTNEPKTTVAPTTATSPTPTSPTPAAQSSNQSATSKPVEAKSPTIDKKKDKKEKEKKSKEKEKKKK